MELAPHAPLTSPRAAAIVGAGAAFGVLAGLVVAGSLTRLDQYAVDHWMPGFSPAPRESPLLSSGLYKPFSLGIPLWEKLLELWTWPASVAVSVVLLGLGAWLLARRGRPEAGLIWIGAWSAANLLEVIGKWALDRPPLYVVEHGGVSVHVIGFDTSFPSGHATRGVVVAALAAYLWPRLRWAAAVWILLTLPFLVVIAAHTPTDVAGGALVGVLAVLGARVALDSRLAELPLRWKASRRS